MSRGVCAIVLAAGQGTRFRQAAGSDRDKLLARCRGRDGYERAVLEHVLFAFRSKTEQLLLVTRPENSGVIALGQANGCRVLTLQSAGMGDSIAAAVAQVADCTGWLIALGDMPFILPESIGRIVEALEDDLIVVPTREGHYGHPVGFGRVYGPQLASLSGEAGAKRLFREGRVCELAVEDAAIHWDIDTPEALVRF